MNSKEIKKELKEDKSTQNSIDSSVENSIDETKEEYTFVRETIKEKPPVMLRAAFKVLQLLGMGIVFGMGICLVLFAFDKDIRDIFGHKNDEIETTKNQVQETTTVPKETASQEIISVEEKINSSLVDVEVIIYRNEDENQTTVPAEEKITGIYEEEDKTAAVSDDKEVHTTATEEKLTEKDTTTAETTKIPEETTEKRQIEEKKHYTGVVIAIKKDIYVCIAYDKVKDGDELAVSFGEGNHAVAGIYGKETINGIAVLSVDVSELDETVVNRISKADIADVDIAGSGDELIYAGKPYEMGRLFYAGTLAGLDDGHSNYDTFYRRVITDITSAGTNDGFIFDGNGKLVAMLNSNAGEPTAGKNITGICMEDMMHIVNALIYNTTIGHIGIKGETVTEDMRDLTQENIPDGMYVTDVARDSASYKSGIMVGDIITQIDGKKVSSIKEIQNVIQFRSNGENVTIVLKRKIGTNYSELTIKVPVEAY